MILHVSVSLFTGGGGGTCLPADGSGVPTSQPMGGGGGVTYLPADRAVPTFQLMGEGGR